MFFLIDKATIIFSQYIISWLDWVDEQNRQSDSRFVHCVSDLTIVIILMVWFIPALWVGMRELDLGYPEGHCFEAHEDRYSEPLEAEIEINWLQEGF